MGLSEPAGGPGLLGPQGKLTPQVPHFSKTAHLEGEEAARAKSMKSWKLRLGGGRTCPGNGMNSGLRLFPPGCHGDGGGGQEGRWAFPFQGPGPAQASMRKMPEAWALGTQDSRPEPLLPQTRGGQVPSTSHFRPKNPGSQSLLLEEESIPGCGLRAPRDTRAAGG